MRRRASSRRLGSRAMRITRQVVTAARSCAICERTLLVGERAVRYSPDGVNFVDVCPLCLETAVDHGWLKEGSPTSPVMAEPRRKRLGGLGALFESRKPQVAPVVDEPILRRLSEPELAMVEAADMFNESAFRRTIAGIAKSLGAPKASIVPLSGTSSEVVLTVAWTSPGTSTASPRTPGSLCAWPSVDTTHATSRRSSP